MHGKTRNIYKVSLGKRQGMRPHGTLKKKKQCVKDMNEPNCIRIGYNGGY
jgi:hypothetical protein